MMLSFMVSLPVLALTVPEAAVETTGDYDAVFLSLSAIVAVVPLIVEIVKGFSPAWKGS